MGVWALDKLKTENEEAWAMWAENFSEEADSTEWDTFLSVLNQYAAALWGDDVSLDTEKLRKRLQVGSDPGGVVKALYFRLLVKNSAEFNWLNGFVANSNDSSDSVDPSTPGSQSQASERVFRMDMSSGSTNQNPGTQLSNPPMPRYQGEPASSSNSNYYQTNTNALYGQHPHSNPAYPQYSSQNNSIPTTGYGPSTNYAQASPKRGINYDQQSEDGSNHGSAQISTYSPESSTYSNMPNNVRTEYLPLNLPNDSLLNDVNRVLPGAPGGPPEMNKGQGSKSAFADPNATTVVPTLAHTNSLNQGNGYQKQSSHGPNTYSSMSGTTAYTESEYRYSVDEPKGVVMSQDGYYPVEQFRNMGHLSDPSSPRSPLSPAERLAPQSPRYPTPVNSPSFSPGMVRKPSGGIPSPGMTRKASNGSVMTAEFPRYGENNMVTRQPSIPQPQLARVESVSSTNESDPKNASPAYVKNENEAKNNAYIRSDSEIPFDELTLMKLSTENPDAATFWKQSFGQNYKVEWPQFVSTVRMYVKLKLWSRASLDEQKIAVDLELHGVVSIVAYRKIVGPFNSMTWLNPYVVDRFVKLAAVHGSWDVQRGRWEVVGLPLSDEQLHLTCDALRPVDPKLFNLVTIKQLSWIQNKPTEAHIKSLGDSLTLNRSLRILILWRNDIGDGGATALGQALQLNSTLEELNLQSNKIGEVGISAIAISLKSNSSLKKLDLRENEAKDKGAVALADALKQNSTLIQLNISRNEIGVEGGTALGSALRENKAMTKLDAAVNPKLGELGMTALVDGGSDCKTLTHLGLSESNLSFFAKRNLQKIITTKRRKDLIVLL
ncbi:hypothetical protein BJ742DRAFT_790376 [Cladochytrium replicatum]|nr:hypothetical protein BJ742DRAFT_790376 [Cladochytrium replicatum]